MKFLPIDLLPHRLFEGLLNKNRSRVFHATALIFSTFIASRAFCETKMTVSTNETNSSTVRLFLSGDVMLGRGIDQILAYHVQPVLFEGFVKDARQYVDLAVALNGPLPVNRSTEYVWGDAIDIFKHMRPDLRIINLETSITERGNAWPAKGIHYRMHPKNIPVISSAGIHCCVLSNNHVLDWGYQGLADTLSSLAQANIKTTGAGQNIQEAQAPAVFNLPHKACRALIFGLGSPSAGVYGAWHANATTAGVHGVDETLRDASMDEQIDRLKQLVRKYRRPRYDLVIFSIHWGGNWGWDLEQGQRAFARRLVDDVGADLIHGHSSHHIKGVEVYKNKLIAYGCGDLLTDYEGIKNSGEEEFREDLSLMYFADIHSLSGHLTDLHLVPMRLKRMQIRKAVGSDEKWLFDNFKRECASIGRLGLDRAVVNDLNAFKLIL